MEFGLGDMNRYIYDAVCVHVKVGGGKWLLPVKIISNNTLETIVFVNSEMNNDSLDAF